MALETTLSRTSEFLSSYNDRAEPSRARSPTHLIQPYRGTSWRGRWLHCVADDWPPTGARARGCMHIRRPAAMHGKRVMQKAGLHFVEGDYTRTRPINHTHTNVRSAYGMDALLMPTWRSCIAAAFYVVYIVSLLTLTYEHAINILFVSKNMCAED